MLERNAHFATIVGAVTGLVCLILTAIETYFTWKMYELAVHSGGEQGASMTSSHVSWILPICFGVVSMISLGVNALAWRMWLNLAKPRSLKSPQELRRYTITTIGDLYEFLIDLDHDPRKPREYSGCGIESNPEDERIKSAFPEQLKTSLSLIEEGADRYKFWKAISLSFYGSNEEVSMLKRDITNDYDVYHLISTLIDLVHAIDGEHKRRDMR